MNSSRPRIDERGAELRAAMEARMQQQRQRPLPRWLASPSRRRAVALVPAVVFAIGVAAALADDGVGLVLMMVMAALGLAGAVVLPKVTEMLATAPEGLLDEREIGQRDRAYRRAFHLALGLLLALLALAVADRVVVRIWDAGLFEGGGWMRLAFAAFFAAAALPAAVLTWRWETPLDDQHE